MRVRFLLALCPLLLAAPATAQDAVEVPLQQLRPQLPLFFNKPVLVRGDLIGWGETASIDSDVSQEVMIDLRPLSEELRTEINRDCTPDVACTATVTGMVVHIRGEGISELGIAAETIELTP